MHSQFFVGTFRLSYVNGVDEGLVIVELEFMLTGLFGV